MLLQLYGTIFNSILYVFLILTMFYKKVSKLTNLQVTSDHLHSNSPSAGTVGRRNINLTFYGTVIILLDIIISLLPLKGQKNGEIFAWNLLKFHRKFWHAEFYPFSGTYRHVPKLMPHQNYWFYLSSFVPSCAIIGGIKSYSTSIFSFYTFEKAELPMLSCNSPVIKKEGES